MTTAVAEEVIPPLQRNERQRKILPQVELDRTRCTVIGCGAVGYNVNKMLAAMGVGSLVLFDHDTVSIENMSSQGWLESQMGLPKVQAAAKFCHLINSHYGEIPPMKYKADNILSIPERFGNHSPREIKLGQDPMILDVVFLCVDNIRTRELIFNSIKDKNVSLIVDGRMSLSSIQVYSSNKPEEREYYSTTFFPESEAHETGCTVQSTLHVASICAALMVESYSRFIQGHPQIRCVGIDTLSMDMTWG